jgi:hypothetical protein
MHFSFHSWRGPAKLPNSKVRICEKRGMTVWWNVTAVISYVNNNNNYYYLLQMGCHPVAVIILHVFPNTTNKFT